MELKNKPQNLKFGSLHYNINSAEVANKIQQLASKKSNIDTVLHQKGDIAIFQLTGATKANEKNFANLIKEVLKTNPIVKNTVEETNKMWDKQVKWFNAKVLSGK